MRVGCLTDGGCNMPDAMTTSWRRRSDTLRSGADSASTSGTQVSPLHVKEVQRLEVWEDEGGRLALSAESVRILIIDYDIRASESLELLLRASGYSETRVAYSGHAGLAIAEDFRPSVVLLELNLLDMSGYEVARLLRGSARRNDLRLIALTSNAQLAGRRLTRGAGIQHYLLKPVAAADLSGLFQMRMEKALRGTR